MRRAVGLTPVMRRQRLSGGDARRSTRSGRSSSRGSPESTPASARASGWPADGPDPRRRETRTQLESLRGCRRRRACPARCPFLRVRHGFPLARELSILPLRERISAHLWITSGRALRACEDSRMTLAYAPAGTAAAVVAERVRDRLRAEQADPARDPELASRIARAEVRRHNDFALARGLAPVDDEASLRARGACRRRRLRTAAAVSRRPDRRGTLDQRPRPHLHRPRRSRRAPPLSP